MFLIAVLFSVFLLSVKFDGASTIRFADNSFIPINSTFIEDDSVETCTGFKNNGIKANYQFTQFRINMSDIDAYYFSVNITGRKLGCGRNLYVSPLSLAESETWLGRWTACMLTTKSYNKNDEHCSYWCRLPCLLEEIQVMRVAHSTNDVYWELCYINITVSYVDGDNKVYTGCSDVASRQNGVYRVKLQNSDDYFDMFCDQTTEGGGWTVILRRVDGSVNFTRDWDEYRDGFGCLIGEFWAGNEVMHKMTTDGRTYLLRVELESYEGEFFFAEYSKFSIGPESDNYRLHVSGYLPNSTAGDSLGLHNGMMFSTASRDNDLYSQSCAKRFGCGWWYRSCHASLLTGKYGENLPTAYGIDWFALWKHSRFARYARMMIRPVN